MVVDDEADILHIIQKALEKYGFAVEGYTDSRKALESFTTRPDVYALVISDIRMPGMSGLVLSEKMWSIRPNLKILFMTAYLPEEINIMHDAIYKRDIIEKPFNIHTICDQVKMRLPASR
jgi:DNA-binding NtrC family response regulator